MNREIKFRAWDIRDRHWIDPEIVDRWAVFSLKLEPMTHIINQYTGRKDKSGKEIYEGDIAEDKVNNCVWRYIIQPLFFMGNNLFAVCIWRNFTVIDGGIVMGDYSAQDGSWNYISSTVEVIGNIYENPELLTGRK